MLKFTNKSLSFTPLASRVLFMIVLFLHIEPLRIRPISTAHEGLESDLKPGPNQRATGHFRASKAANGVGKTLHIFNMSYIIVTIAQHSYSVRSSRQVKAAGTSLDLRSFCHFNSWQAVFVPLIRMTKCICMPTFPALLKL